MEQERQEILKGLLEVLRTIRTIDPARLEGVTEETDFLKDLSTPSTELINIAAKVEHKFGIEFDDDDIERMGSKVKDIIDLVISVKKRGEND